MAKFAQTLSKFSLPMQIFHSRPHPRPSFLTEDNEEKKGWHLGSDWVDCRTDDFSGEFVCAFS
jgi:hypothetical protein